jgi:hypothetical protein
MNKSISILLAVAGVLVIGFGLVYFGIVLGRFGWFPWVGQTNPNDMMGGTGSGYYMMGETGSGYSMMGGHGMTGGYGMMDGYSFNSGATVEPLSIADVDEAVHEYLEGFRYDDLLLGEIMIFDNHGYAQIVEESTGIGAMEVLIDPVTLAVIPEYGPNMMWNLKYGHMGGFDGYGMGVMMSGYGMMGMGNPNINFEDAEDMSVTEEEAVETAQQYLDQYFLGTQADEHADPFYGYYTIHVLRDGEVLGMLSVNGFNGQVFLHTWHGDFIEMSEH